MKSAIYHGWLRHRRFAPRAHAFRYRLFLVYLDLAEAETVFAGRWFWSTRRFALARFRRQDHLGPADVPLDVAVRDLVEGETGARPQGPIRLLTQLRTFGYVFNPVSFYYCYRRPERTGAEEDEEQLEAIVAEIVNTPWGERHCYVLPCKPSAGSGARQRFRFDKRFHVSPFMPMDVGYDWRFAAPGRTLAVHMALHRPGRIFDATMRLQRAPISTRSLAWVLLAFPLMSFKVIGAIYWQALRLFLKRVPFHAHPARTPAPRREAAPGDGPASGAAAE